MLDPAHGHLPGGQRGAAVRPHTQGGPVRARGGHPRRAETMSVGRPTRTGRATVGETFVRLTGRPPSVIASAPGRVNLIGDHIDYSGGIVLPFALAQRPYAALAARTDGRVLMRSLQRADSLAAPVCVAVDCLDDEPIDGWAAYVAGVVWALRQRVGTALFRGGL